jgi:hypothetical protein
LLFAGFEKQIPQAWVCGEINPNRRQFDMTTETFFLEDIRKENYRQGLSPEKEAALDKYLEEMASGSADGEMDIDWQSEGRGYYLHDHILYGIKNERERLLYLQKLREDINIWLSEKPNHYMVEQVRDRVFGA